MKDNKTFKGAIIIGGLILILYMIFSDKYDYQILKESEMRNEKKELDIGLNTKVSKDELDKIAKELKKEFNNFERIYIWFHLENDLKRKPWAVANYQNEQWNIVLTATKELENKLKSTTTDGKTVGKWYTETPTSASSIIFFIKENKIFCTTTFHNSQSLQSELTTEDNITFNYVEYFAGEYYKIEPNGNLGFYNKNNIKFLEAYKYN